MSVLGHWVLRYILKNENPCIPVDMTNAIETDLVTKKYPQQNDNHLAINQISLNVEKGQLYGLIGPDGAGKTTLLRILSTVLIPTSGYASLSGFDVVKEAEDVRSRIGYMPQAFSLYPDLSVDENIRFFAEIHGVAYNKQRERIKELLDFAQLSKFRQRRSENLSGGMRKKLALACALIHEPEILILDEPTTGVDPISRQDLWRLLTDVINLGVTVLISTPYMDEAEKCDIVSIIYKGKILITGTPRDLIDTFPHQILELKAKPRKILRRVINEIDLISRWRAVGDHMRLSVSDSKKALTVVERQLKNAGVEIELLHNAHPKMEDIFIHLVESREDLI